MFGNSFTTQKKNPLTLYQKKSPFKTKRGFKYKIIDFLKSKLQ